MDTHPSSRRRREAVAAYTAMTPTERAGHRSHLDHQLRLNTESLAGAGAAMADVLVAEAALEIRHAHPTATTLVFTLTACDPTEQEWEVEIHSIRDGGGEMLWAGQGRKGFDWAKSRLESAREHADDWYTPARDGLWQISVAAPPLPISLPRADWQHIVKALQLAADVAGTEAGVNGWSVLAKTLTDALKAAEEL
jgi:hypothetical protein